MSVVRPLVLTSLLAAGCTVGPNYVRPADPSQTTYVTQDSNSASHNAAPDHTQTVAFGETPPDDWWTLLGSEELDRLVKLALANNQSLASARRRICKRHVNESVSCAVRSFRRSTLRPPRSALELARRSSVRRRRTSLPFRRMREARRSVMTWISSAAHDVA